MTEEHSPIQKQRELFDSMFETILAKLDGIRNIMDERDLRYKERDISNKEAVRAALASAEKASEKTESVLKEYKASSNEWRDTVKDLVSKMITRPDVERELKVIDEKIADLREPRSLLDGTTITKKEDRTQRNWSTGLIVVAGMSVISVILTILHMVMSK